MRKLLLFLFIFSSYRSLAISRVEKRLVAFANLYSTVKFYYPDPNIHDFSWTALAYKGYELANKSKSDEEFVQEVIALMRTLAPGVVITKGKFDLKSLIPNSSEYKMDAYWQHQSALNVGARAEVKQLSTNYIINKQVGVHEITQHFSPIAKRMNDAKIKISFWAKLEGNIDSVKALQLTPFSRKTKTFSNFYVSVDTKEWKRYEQIIDYPKECEVDKIHIVLPPSGTLYIDNLTFEKKDSNDKWIMVPMRNTDFEDYNEQGELVGWEDPMSGKNIYTQDANMKKEGKYGLKMIAIQDKNLYKMPFFEKPTMFQFINDLQAYVPIVLKANKTKVYPNSDKEIIKTLSDSLAKKIESKTETRLQAIASAIEIYGYLLHDKINENGLTRERLEELFLNGIRSIENKPEVNAWHNLFIDFLAWTNDVQIYAQPTSMMFGNMSAVQIPCQAAIVDNKVIVEKTFKADKIKVGDWLQKIDNISLDSLIQSMQAVKMPMYLQDLVRGKYLNSLSQEKATLTINRNGKIVEETFLASDNVRKVVPKVDSLEEDEVNTINKLSKESKQTLYINPNIENILSKRQSDKENNYIKMDTLVKRWNTYQTLVIDCRDQQQNNLLEYLLTYLPKVDRTKMYEMSKTTYSPFGASKLEPYQAHFIGKRNVSLTPKLIFLIDYHTRGLTEYLLFVLKQQGLATFIGTSTAGGGVHANQLRLNNNLRFQYSATQLVNSKMQVSKGVQPDIEVQPTQKAILSGKDEVIERAFE